MTNQQLERLLLIAAALGELHFHHEVMAKICKRLAAFACTSDEEQLSFMYDELQQILADEGATLVQRLRGPIH
jgi:hypothetical protein